MILAAALILAKIVAEEQETFPVRMRFLFEPAEEIGEGAEADDPGRGIKRSQTRGLF